jgi:hypothetical protein
LYSTSNSPACFSLTSFTLEDKASITLTPLYEDGTTILEISQSILNCIGEG